MGGVTDRSTFPARRFVPRYDFAELGWLHSGWQACESHEALAPVRMFQWEAIADLPEAAKARPEPHKRYSLMEPYRVRHIRDDRL